MVYATTARTFDSAGCANHRYIGWRRHVITPFGPELGLENLIVVDDRLAQLEVRVGDGLGASTWLADIAVDPLIRKTPFSLGARLSVWHQPGFEELHDGTGFRRRIRDLRQHPSGPGAADRLPFSHPRRNGAKTAGFLEGERLDRTPIVRIGEVWRFDEARGTRLNRTGLAWRFRTEPNRGLELLVRSVHNSRLMKARLERATNTTWWWHLSHGGVAG